MKRGVTLIELVVALATAAVIGLVSAGLMRLGFKTYQYTVRQNDVLSSARGALSGTGKVVGILGAVESAASVSNMSGNTLTAVSTSAATTVYSLGTGGLYQTKSGVTTLAGVSVSTMSISYYNLDSSGLIMRSTAASAATFVTVLVTMQGANRDAKTYKLFAGAQLRNHP